MGLINLYKKLKLNKLIHRAVDNPKLLSSSEWWTELWTTLWQIQEIRMALSGYKTYIIASLAGALTVAHMLGYVDDETFRNLLALLGAGAATTVAAKVNRINTKVDTANNHIQTVKNKLLVIPFLLCCATLSYAQTPPSAIPTSKLQWNQEAGSVTDAQGLTYKYYADTSTLGVALSNVTCVMGPAGATDFICMAPFPAFSPGRHTLTLTTSDVSGESPKSDPPLAFTFIVIPSAPTRVTIVNR